jgi:hypothetical protein
MWAGYFLLPWFFLFLCELIEDGDRRAALELSLLLFAEVLLGAFHLFVWCVFLLVLVAANRKRLRRPILAASAWALALSLCRLLPAYFLINRKDQLFVSGFPSVGDLWQALTSLRGAGEPPHGGLFGELRWWEYDTYVGVVGLGLLLYFGIYRPWRHGRALAAGRALEVPLLVLVVLAMGDLYAVFNVLPIPLVDTERVSSRFLILPLVYLTLSAAVEMQRLLEADRRRLLRAGLAAAVVATAGTLAAHSALWRVAHMHALVPHVRTNLEFGLSDPAHEPDNLREHAYVAVVRGSFAASVLALGAWAWRMRMLARGAPPRAAPATSG